MYPFKYDVSFRVHHPSMDPDDICRTLGMKTNVKWKAGAERMTPTGKYLQGMHETTYCSFRLKHSRNIELSDFLKKYNNKLYKHKDFFKYMRLTGGTLEYFIGWFNDKDSGQTFDLELLKGLIELGIELAICVYQVPENSPTDRKRNEKRRNNSLT